MTQEVECIICGRRISKDEAFYGPTGDTAFCKDHRPKIEKYGLDLPDYLKNRIAVTLSEDEPRMRFVVRELVQNADDEGAAIIVLRFEEDALYVANDGRPFSKVATGNKPPDFEKIRRVLRRYKEDDKEFTGHFGSGFQTVYTITNVPEIHSNGQWESLYPTENAATNVLDNRVSPYVSNEEERQGVLFRFPWRTDAEAEKVFEGTQPFKDSNSWPRWNDTERRDAFLDLKGYLSDLLLFCNHLRTIRIVWFDGPRSESYETRRRFDFSILIERPEPVEIEEGALSVESEWYSWEKGFAKLSVIPKSFSLERRAFVTGRNRRFLAASKRVKENDGQTAHLVKNPDGKVSIQPQVPQGWKEIKNNVMHLVFPISEREGGVQKSLLYSVIPLPKSGENMFGFSAHLIPTEDRKDVDIHGNGGINDDWYKACMLTMVDLYRETFTALLTFLRGSDADRGEKLRVVLMNLPRVEVGDWMRPGKGDLSWAHEVSESLFDWLFSLKMIATAEGLWITPSTSYWTEDAETARVMAILRTAMYPDSFIVLCKSLGWLQKRSSGQNLTPSAFADIWQRLLVANKFSPSQRESLKLGTKVTLPWVDSKAEFSTDDYGQLVRYALARPDTAGLELVPGADGFLRRLDSYPKLPVRLASINKLFPASWNIHGGFEKIIGELESANDFLRKEVGFDDIPDFLSKAIEAQPERFNPVKEDDHLILAEGIRAIVLDTSFAHPKAIGKRFLPHKWRGKIIIGPLPAVEAGEHGGEKYERGWIFAQHRVNIEGLPTQLEASIRILDLKGVPTKLAEKVEKDLWLVPLASREDKPTDYIRHFISIKHGSLFNDNVMEEFTGVRDSRAREDMKLTMLKAVRVYFDKEKQEDDLKPKEMGEVPCLYDSSGEWHKANEFSLGTGVFASILRKRTLHPELVEWGPTRLEALGVMVTIGPEQVAQRIKELASDGRSNRTNLGNFFGAIVSEYPSESLTDLSRRVKEMAWIPIGNSGLSKSSDTMAPTPSVISIIGRSSSFIDTTCMEKGVREDIEKWNQGTLERVAKLGVRTSPRSDEVAQMVLSVSHSNLEPPPKLFQVISALIKEKDEVVTRALIASATSPKFFWNGRWFEGKQIRIMYAPEEHIPFESLGLLLLSPEEADPFLHYIRFIGALETMSVDDYLRALVFLSDQARHDRVRLADAKAIYDRVWSRVGPILGSELSEEAKSIFGKEQIILVGGRWYRPVDILLMEWKGHSEALTFGTACIYSTTSDSTKSLQMLGASRLDSLNGPSANAFLASAATSEALSAEQAEAYLSILAYGTKKGWWAKDRAALTPVSKTGEIHLGRPKEALTGNGSLVNVLREATSVLCSIDGRFDVGLVRLAQEWGARDIAGEIEYPDGEDLHERDRETESMLTRALVKLSRYLPDEVESLDEVKALEVRRVVGGLKRYSIGPSQGHFSLPSILPTGYGHASLFLALDQGELGDRELRLLVDWAVGAGFPEEKRIQLSQTLKVTWAEISELAEDEDIEDLSPEERDRYVEIRDKLNDMYTGCQVCAWRTPADEGGVVTLETVKSVVSERGGLYAGKKGALELSNTLYLCPRHAKLASRHLMRFPFMKAWRVNRKEVLEDLARRSATVDQEISEENPMYKTDIQVFAWLSTEPAGWRTQILKLNPTHAKGLFERLARFVEES